MTHNRKFIHQTTPVKRTVNTQKEIKNIYWGEVELDTDRNDGGVIKVRIKGLDGTKEEVPPKNLPDAFPLIPKFLHQQPSIGEIVRILIPDRRFPNSGRLWSGAIISQPHKIGFDEKVSALSTTNEQLVAPDKAPSTFPEAVGIYPKLRDIALLGRNNSDVILSNMDAEIRAGKHELLDTLKLNKLNPASLKLTYEETTGTTPTVSTGILMADRIALITHEGIPKFKAAQLNSKDRDLIFTIGHPLGRGDVIVEALEALKDAILDHIHGYSGLSADKSDKITALENKDFTQILNKNIVIN